MVQASLVLADFYEKEGQVTDAVRVLEAAARLTPEDRLVKQKLDELRRRQG